ncbi:MAG: hypothetical protein LIP23_08575, partial [Planctomycetes bacterium]|nr:hypothetical protein [Planctomycetota bacterium]
MLTGIVDWRKTATHLWRPFLLLAALLLASGAARAATQPVVVNGTSYQNLAAAAAAIRTAAAATVQINANQATVGTGAGYAWNLVPAAPNTGYTNLAITGGSSMRTLGPTGTGTRGLMEIGTITGTGNLTNLRFQNGTITNTAAAGGVDSDIIRGAGLHVYDLQGTINLTNITALNNTIDMRSSSAVANPYIGANGAGIYIDGRDLTYGNVAQGTAAFNNVTISGNRVATTNTVASDSSANGGGALINSVESFSFTNGTVANNSASATRADHAHGGGMSLEYSIGTPSAVLSDVTITGNTARLTNADGVTNAGNYSRGGGVMVYKSDETARAGFTAEDAVFSNNQAIVDGTTAAGHTATASGGAIDFFGNISGTFTDVTFTNNSAQALAAGANALGGAFAHDSGAGDARFERATFERNTVTATGAAMGGAIYHQNGTLEIIDTAIRDNTVTGATAFGGGIYIDAPFGDSMVRLSATAGNTTVISGNTANGVADGIYFGQYTGNAPQNSTLMVEGTGRTMLLDPVTVNVDGNFTMNTTSSDLHWDQANVWRADTATLALNNSTTRLGANFSLDTSQSAAENVMFGSSTILFAAARDRDSAIFNFSDAASYFGNAMLGVDTERQLIDLSGTYLIAENEIDTYLTADAASVSDIYTQGGSTYADVDAASPYADAIASAGANVQNAAAALNQLVSDRLLISDQDFARIRRNFASTVPQLAADQAGVAVDISTRFAEDAVRIGLRKPFFESRYNYGASPYRGTGRRYAGLSADQALASMIGSYH